MKIKATLKYKLKYYVSYSFFADKNKTHKLLMAHLFSNNVYKHLILQK